ncbi:hypothetical protein R5R35_004008 [Gryllus longicercus]|uniref:Uncharacterized protein n=1 Tax=Gryllus longicercus TaxID=2509291 RepID=A0AAN9VLC6_9ORTH
MPGSRSSNDPDHKSPRESGEDSEDESEILEESPCGRWLKRREEVKRVAGLSLSCGLRCKVRVLMPARLTTLPLWGIHTSNSHTSRLHIE